MLLAAQPAVHTVAAPTRKTAVKSAYTVKKGDNLWLICQRELGDAGAVAMVVRDNRISNPGALKAGDVIYLPKK
jgi:nucleoid-associated protein YgaU